MGVELVVDLIDHDLNRWRVDVLNLLFPPEEARAIQAIPLQRRLTKDSLCWNLNADGNYSVRSGYNLATQEPASEPEEEEEEIQDLQAPSSPDWEAMWKVNSPPKVHGVRL
ncbi:unnamed protein product, partial [Linum tenue]